MLRQKKSGERHESRKNEHKTFLLAAWNKDFAWTGRSIKASHMYFGGTRRRHRRCAQPGSCREDAWQVFGASDIMGDHMLWQATLRHCAPFAVFDERRFRVAFPCALMGALLRAWCIRFRLTQSVRAAAGALRIRVRRCVARGGWRGQNSNHKVTRPRRKANLPKKTGRKKPGVADVWQQP